MFQASTILPRLLPSLALAGLTLGTVQAQNAGRISGQVRDEAGQPLVGVTVLLQPLSKGTATNAQGQFEISGVPAGTYMLVTSYLGYRNASQSITIGPGNESVTADATLSVDPLQMSGVVVTGTFNPQSKLESSTAITTLSNRQIENRVARGTADLLMAVPGFRVNSDGGEAANSVSPRGLPVNAEAGFGFLQLMEDGLPLLEVGSLTFAKTDIHFRLDETISRLEVVRGGSASIFANNAPGGIVNFLSKTGNTPKISGIVKLTGGDQGFHSDRTGASQLFGLQRVDANVGGPIAGTPLKFNIGGFYRYDVGQKYAGYPANVGGGVKANVTYGLKNGYVRLYGKYLNDRVAYYTSVPYQNLNDPQQIPGGPGFRYGTMQSQYQRRTTIPNPFNNGQGSLSRDLADGQHTRYKSISSEVFIELGNGFTLTDNARLLDANLSTDGVYDLQPPVSGAAFANQFLAGYRPLGATGYQFTYADNGQPVDINTLNGNGLVNLAGIFPDDKPATNAINNLRLQKSVGKHQLTGGFYASRYTIKERLSYNLVVQEVSNRPRLLNLTLSTASPTGQALFGGQPIEVTNNGFLYYSYADGILFNSRNTTQVLSYYAGDEWQATEKLRIDGGIRLETSHAEGSSPKTAILVNPDAQFTRFVGAPSAANRYGGSNGGLDGQYRTLYDNRFLQNTSDARTWDYRFSTFNYSLGANYKFSDQLATYARFSKAGVAPTNDQWAYGVDLNDASGNSTLRGEVQRVLQAEAGLKVATKQVGVSLVPFYSQNDNIPFTVQVSNPDGSFTLVQQRGKVDNRGLELEATYSPVQGLTLRGIGTAQRPRYQDFNITVPLDPPMQAQRQTVNLKGNRLEDTPDLLLEGGGEYTRSGFTVFSNYRWFGKRYATKRNTIELPSYGVLYGGLGYVFGGENLLKGLEVRVQGANLLNKIGFGDAAARNGENFSTTYLNATAANGNTNAQNAYNLVRPILPRNITASVAYRF
ncbi:TonB-dependent receptor [Hymenobacter taeanensis]|uniref:TonB-dependent receptor n=1 Tax=Hymenobacter taeanensis TaxID=2735321 RepID=A0A6M6BLP9_9BACT|nr:MULTISPECIES: TonB-dependent receptor [Hymenobacter]QJX48907.1 TonB-dependent receptor [Hymenobacter taeanensis]UOQ81578.1 TonB-dependent receptor [Hymenobacter sp. 5414T-23]